MGNRIGATVVALVLCVSVVAAAHAQSQPKDSSATFSLFGGGLLNGTGGMSATTLMNMEFGGSADFRISAIPVPLRATVAFRQEDSPWAFNSVKYGTLSLDAVGKPIPRIFGLQPYLLGGLGVATRSNYLAYDRIFTGSEVTFVNPHQNPRGNWAFVEGGLGLELGRHLFIQTKIMTPVASQGPLLMPVSVGFRFWD